MTKLCCKLQLAGRLHDLGAPLVTLRCGADGAFVSQRGGGAWSVPAVPGTHVVDVTGELAAPRMMLA